MCDTCLIKVILCSDCCASQAGSVWNQSIVSLQPYTKYEFKARVRLSHRRGIWSDWSQPASNWTQEEGKNTNTALCG